MTDEVLDCEYKCAHCDRFVLRIEPRGTRTGDLIADRFPREDDPLLCDKCNGVSIFKAEGEELVLVPCIVDFLDAGTQHGIRCAQLRNAGKAMLDILFSEEEE